MRYLVHDKNQILSNDVKKELASFSKKTLINAARFTAGAAVNLVKDGTEIVSGLRRKDYKAVSGTLGKCVFRRVKGIACLGAVAANTAYYGGKTVYRHINKKDLNQQDIDKLMKYGVILSGAALSIIVCGEIYDALGLSSASAAVPEDLPLLIPGHDLSVVSYIDDGIFVGNMNDLDEIIQMGEVDNTAHLTSAEVVRDTHMETEFLHLHNLESKPMGYELHHIIPLSQGGADIPENMVLMPEHLHHMITAAHKEYYGW